MTWLDLVVMALATWQIVEIWHHGSLFAGYRAYWESRPPWEVVRWPILRACAQRNWPRPYRLRNHLGWWQCWRKTCVGGCRWAHLYGDLLAELLLCAFCLSFWASGLSLILWDFGWTRPLVWILAIARLANLSNDLTHSWCRTPRPHHDVNYSPFEDRSNTGDPGDPAEV